MRSRWIDHPFIVDKYTVTGNAGVNAIIPTMKLHYGWRREYIGGSLGEYDFYCDESIYADREVFRLATIGSNAPACSGAPGSGVTRYTNGVFYAYAVANTLYAIFTERSLYLVVDTGGVTSSDGYLTYRGGCVPDPFPYDITVKTPGIAGIGSENYAWNSLIKGVLKTTNDTTTGIADTSTDGNLIIRPIYVAFGTSILGVVPNAVCGGGHRTIGGMISTFPRTIELPLGDSPEDGTGIFVSGGGGAFFRIS